MSKSFTFFQSFADSARKMSDAERLAFYDAMVNCAIYGETAEHLPPMADLVFTAIKPILEANVRDRDNGKNGGRPRKENPLNNPSENPFKNPLDNPPAKPKVEYSKVDVEYSSVEESKEKVAVAPSVFRKPSITEIAMYCKARNNNVDAEAFWSFYESKGWKVGNATMKDWKAAVITWEKRRKEDGNNQKYSTTEQRTMVCHDWSNEHPTL